MLCWTFEYQARVSGPTGSNKQTREVFWLFHRFLFVLFGLNTCWFWRICLLVKLWKCTILGKGTPLDPPLQGERKVTLMKQDLEKMTPLSTEKWMDFSPQGKEVWVKCWKFICANRKWKSQFCHIAFCSKTSRHSEFSLVPFFNKYKDKVNNRIFPRTTIQ